MSIARRLAVFRTQVYASPNYLARHGEPLHPDDLQHHRTLAMQKSRRNGAYMWTLSDGDRSIDYRVDPSRADGFYAEIRRYWPGLRDGALQPAYSGVRPKLQRPGEPAGDFVLQGPAEHGIGGLMNLFGIESPGLTSSLAIAEVVAQRLTPAA